MTVKMVCYGLTSHQISTQLNNYGRFWTDVWTLHHHHQNAFGDLFFQHSQDQCVAATKVKLYRRTVKCSLSWQVFVTEIVVILSSLLGDKLSLYWKRALSSWKSTWLETEMNHGKTVVSQYSLMIRFFQNLLRIIGLIMRQRMHFSSSVQNHQKSLWPKLLTLDCNL